MAGQSKFSKPSVTKSVKIKGVAMLRKAKLSLGGNVSLVGAVLSALGCASYPVIAIHRLTFEVGLASNLDMTASKGDLSEAEMDVFAKTLGFRVQLMEVKNSKLHTRELGCGNPLAVVTLENGVYSAVVPERKSFTLNTGSIEEFKAALEPAQVMLPPATPVVMVDTYPKLGMSGGVIMTSSEPPMLTGVSYKTMESFAKEYRNFLSSGGTLHPFLRVPVELRTMLSIIWKQNAECMELGELEIQRKFRRSNGYSSWRKLSPRRKVLAENPQRRRNSPFGWMGFHVGILSYRRQRTNSSSCM